MKQTYINQLKDHIGETVTLKGWLYNKRSSGKLVFLQFRDGTGIVQCVVFKPNDEALYDLAGMCFGHEELLVRFRRARPGHEIAHAVQRQRSDQQPDG